MLATNTITALSVLQWKDTSVGNSKTFLIPSDAGYQLLWGYVRLQAVASAGNRRIQILVTDTDATTIRYRGWNGGTAQNTASSDYDYPVMPGSGAKDQANQFGYNITVPVNFLLQPGWNIKVYEQLNFNVGDTLSVCFNFGKVALM